MVDVGLRDSHVVEAPVVGFRNFDRRADVTAQTSAPFFAA